MDSLDRIKMFSDEDPDYAPEADITPSELVFSCSILTVYLFWSWIPFAFFDMVMTWVTCVKFVIIAVLSYGEFSVYFIEKSEFVISRVVTLLWLCVHISALNFS